MDNSTRIPNTFQRTEKEKQALIEALKEMPIIQVACKRAGVGRATYYRWRKEDERFFQQSEDAIGQGFDFVNDMSESQIVTLIREKKMPAIALWLKTHHPRYGLNAKPPNPVTTVNYERGSLLLQPGHPQYALYVEYHDKLNKATYEYLKKMNEWANREDGPSA